MGEGGDGREIGNFGLGKRNDRGQTMVEFCKRNNMTITNTRFEHEKRRRYTWMKAGDSGRYQLDYILVRQRYCNSVKNARSYPGADMDSDHNLVMMNARISLKKLQRGSSRKKWRIEGVEGRAAAFQTETLRILTEGDIVQGTSVDEDWVKFRDAVKRSAEGTIGYQTARKAKKPWVSAAMIEKMDERRKWKNVDNDNGKTKYRQLNNELRRETDRARECWWKEQCDELEEMDKKGRHDLMYARVKQITRTAKTGANSSIAIKNKSGMLLTEPREVKNRWKQYIEELYCAHDKPQLVELKLEAEKDVGEDN